MLALPGHGFIEVLFLVFLNLDQRKSPVFTSEYLSNILFSDITTESLISVHVLHDNSNTY